MEGLAQSVPGTLMNVGFDIHKLLADIVNVQAKLPELVSTVTRDWPYDEELVAGRLDVPADDFDTCAKETERLAAAHVGAGTSFRIYVALGGIGGGNHEESWLAWKAHHAEARRHAAAARRRLRAASACALAFADGVRVACYFTRWTSDWVDWIMAANQLARLAMASARMARWDLHRMRWAIALEFHDVWTVLHPAGQDV